MWKNCPLEISGQTMFASPLRMRLRTSLAQGVEHVASPQDVRDLLSQFLWECNLAGR